MNAPILSTGKLAVGYGSTTVLEGMDLDFYPGEFVSLLGPDGAGKTTLLRSLSRHLPVLAGDIRLGGRSLNGMPAPELTRRLSVVLTHKNIPPLFQVYEFVAMGRYPYTTWTGRLSADDDAAVSEALALVRAKDLAFRDLDTLSDGERQKVFIARALVQNPRIILLDEPSVHLDTEHRMEIMAILRRLCVKKGITVIASLCDLDVAARVSDRVALIQGKTISAFGRPEEVLDRQTVSGFHEFSGTGINTLLGKIGIKGKAGTEKVYVVGGMGSGTTLYRLLAKQGYEVTTGILMENDIDCVVARSVGAVCHVQADPSQVSHMLTFDAMAALESCDLVLDTGFRATALNRTNLELLDRALALNKTVFAMDRGEPRLGYKSRPDLVWLGDRETLLVDMMARQLKSKPEKTA